MFITCFCDRSRHNTERPYCNSRKRTLGKSYFTWISRQVFILLIIMGMDVFQPYEEYCHFDCRSCTYTKRTAFTEATNRRLKIITGKPYLIVPVLSDNEPERALCVINPILNSTAYFAMACLKSQLNESNVVASK